jgi:hypothetical protein
MPCLTCETCKKDEMHKTIGGTIEIGMRGCSTREPWLQDDTLKILRLALGCHANGILLGCVAASKLQKVVTRDAADMGMAPTVQCFLSRAGPCVKCAWKRGR